MKSMKPLSCLLLGCLLMAPVANADKGFYVGAGLGLSRTELSLVENGLTPEPASFPNTGTLDSTNFSGTGFAFKGFAGYKFFDYFAIELGYVDLGDADDDFCLVASGGAEEGRCIQGDPPLNTFFNQGNPWSVESSTSGWTLEAVGILPVAERWDLFAKLGLFSWDARLTALDAVAAAPGRPTPTPPPNFPPLPPLPNLTPITTKQSGDDLTFGVGGSFDATEHLSIRAEFQWFDIPFADTVWIGTFSGYYRF